MFASKGQRRDCVFLFVYMYMYVCVYICAVCVGIKGVAVERGGKRGKKKTQMKGGWISQSPGQSASPCQSAFRLRGVGPKPPGFPK